MQKPRITLTLAALAGVTAVTLGAWLLLDGRRAPPQPSSSPAPTVTTPPHELRSRPRSGALERTPTPRRAPGLPDPSPGP
ncbi:hypothetical protein [Marinithermus hydrothermalis]|uniref:hypothetical protein n=1 Tax=Marinithermus hydrothermalis TaxID=186192 RepID=UPI0002E00191|nr:hypothetical protein [Marinithermus hydrothermalis]